MKPNDYVSGRVWSYFLSTAQHRLRSGGRSTTSSRESQLSRRPSPLSERYHVDRGPTTRRSRGKPTRRRMGGDDESPEPLLPLASPSSSLEEREVKAEAAWTERCPSLLCATSTHPAFTSKEEFRRWYDQQKQNPQRTYAQTEEMADLLVCASYGYTCPKIGTVPRPSTALTVEETQELTRELNELAIAPTIQDVLSPQHREWMVRTLDRLPLSPADRARSLKQFDDNIKALRRTASQRTITKAIVSVTDVILQYFGELWTELTSLVSESWSSSDAKEQTVAMLEAEGERKGWWARLKRTGRSVGSLLWKAAAALASGLWAIGKWLIKGLISVSQMILANPSTSRLALLMANNVKNDLCRQVGEWWRDNKPIDLNQAIEGRTIEKVLRNATPGVARTFVQSSSYDTAWESATAFLGSTFGSGAGQLIGLAVPGLGLATQAVVSGLVQAGSGVLKQATRETVVMLSYQSDVKAGFRLLWEFINPMECWLRWTGFQTKLDQLMVQFESYVDPDELAENPTATLESLARQAETSRQRGETYGSVPFFGSYQQSQAEAQREAIAAANEYRRLQGQGGLDSSPPSPPVVSPTSSLGELIGDESTRRAQPQRRWEPQPRRSDKLLLTAQGGEDLVQFNDRATID